MGLLNLNSAFAMCRAKPEVLPPIPLMNGKTSFLHELQRVLPRALRSTGPAVLRSRDCPPYPRTGTNRPSPQLGELLAAGLLLVEPLHKEQEGELLDAVERVGRSPPDQSFSQRLSILLLSSLLVSMVSIFYAASGCVNAMSSSICAAVNSRSTASSPKLAKSP